MKPLSLFLLILLVTCSMHAQEVFKKHGFKKDPLTLSKGQYKETFSNDEVVQIGSVLLNTRTNKVVQFLEENTIQTAYKAEFSSRWLSPDPLAEKYYSISPYAYCNNNPIRFVDPDGRKIVGANGKPVTYSSEKGWSKNASSDVIRIGNALMMTEKGTERLNAMMKSDVSINMKISSEMKIEDGGLITGKVTNVKATVKDGKVEVKSLDLNLYEGSIADVTDPNGKYQDSMSEGLTMDEAIGAIAGHESEHTETSNIQQQYDNQYKGSSNDVEAKPLQTQQKIIDELKTKSKQ